MAKLNFYKEVANLYNGEVKLHFLEDADVEEHTKLTYYHTFRRAEETCRLYQKDLYEMNVDEIDEFIYSCRIKSISSVITVFSHINVYSRWAVANNYSDNHLKNITKTSLSMIADKYIFKSSSVYYTQDELKDMYSTLTNIQDIFILQCIFEGIRGKSNSEIRHLTMDDLYEKEGKFYANLYDVNSGIETIGHEISSYLYDIANETSKATFIDDNRKIPMQLTPSKYILKKSDRGLSQSEIADVVVNNSVILNKAFYLKTLFGNTNFSLRNVEKSGIMHYINEVMKEKYPDSKVVTYEVLRMVSERFKIGRQYNEEYGKNFYNYNTIKNYIDEEWLTETYGYTIARS